METRKALTAPADHGFYAIKYSEGIWSAVNKRVSAVPCRWSIVSLVVFFDHVNRRMRRTIDIHRNMDYPLSTTHSRFFLAARLSGRYASSTAGVVSRRSNSSFTLGASRETIGAGTDKQSDISYRQKFVVAKLVRDIIIVFESPVNTHICRAYFVNSRYHRI